MQESTPPERASSVLVVGRKNNSVPTVSVWSEGGEEQEGGGEEQEGGWGRAWKHSLPVEVEDSVCSEPHLEVDKEEEPKTVPIQETC